MLTSDGPSSGRQNLENCNEIHVMNNGMLGDESHNACFSMQYLLGVANTYTCSQVSGVRHIKKYRIWQLIKIARFTAIKDEPIKLQILNL